MPIVVPVCTLNSTVADFAALFRLWRQLNGDRLHVQFDFSHCGFLRSNAVAFLGGLSRLIEWRQGRVEFLWETLRPEIRANLAQCGFIAARGGPDSPWTGNSIPYLFHGASDPTEFAGYLAARWLGRGWIGISDRLRDAVVSNVSEAYVNVFDHAQSPVGVHCCGQHYPKMQFLALTIVDFGVGIPSNVRLFLADRREPESLPAASCLEWAFQRGTTTRPGISRGLGLDLLAGFVRANGGRLEVFSHEGYALLKDGRLHFSQLGDFFEGTLLHVVLRCDERFYALATEVPSATPF